MPIPDELLKDLSEEDRLIITTVLAALERGICPYCRSTNFQQVGRRVYCGDCERRLYQGFVPRRSPDSDE